MELMQKNKDELGYVTIREFYRRSSVGVNFMIDSERTVAGKIAKNSDLTDEEEKCVKYLQEKREDFEMICDTIVRVSCLSSNYHHLDSIKIVGFFFEYLVNLTCLLELTGGFF